MRAILNPEPDARARDRHSLARASGSRKRPGVVAMEFAIVASLLFILLLGMIGLMAVGVLWIRRIVNFEI